VRQTISRLRKNCPAIHSDKELACLPSKVGLGLAGETT
jgi:hypothetical protein